MPISAMDKFVCQNYGLKILFTEYHQFKEETQRSDKEFLKEFGFIQLDNDEENSLKWFKRCKKRYKKHLQENPNGVCHVAFTEFYMNLICALPEFKAVKRSLNFKLLHTIMNYQGRSSYRSHLLSILKLLKISRPLEKGYTPDNRYFSEYYTVGELVLQGFLLKSIVDLDIQMKLKERLNKKDDIFLSMLEYNIKNTLTTRPVDVPEQSYIIHHIPQIVKQSLLDYKYYEEDIDSDFLDYDCEYPTEGVQFKYFSDEKKFKEYRDKQLKAIFSNFEKFSPEKLNYFLGFYK